MKAVDIATKNHVSLDDVLKICEELDIKCKDENSEINDNDVFLVEKKIETIKEHRAQETRQLLEKQKAERNKGKKIKLKRKVQVSKELKEGIQKEEEQKEEAQKPAQKPKKAPAKPKKEEKPAQERKKQAPASRQAPRKAQAGEKKGKPAEAAEERPEAKKPVAEGEKVEIGSMKEESKKRQKGKEKSKEKAKKKGTKREREELREKDLGFKKKKPQAVQKKPREAVTPKNIEITETIQVGDLAKKLNVKANEVIAKLMQMGVMATINQVIDAETAEILASEYGTEVKVVSLFDETVIKLKEEDRDEDYASRPPIVTVMGHVDHGKTKLLDAVRQANVTSVEHGGITQHIGAYRVKVNDRYVTFLDTPGHEAFTTMRARGARVTDIVILVVAANDGVMPQTVEAINHAKDAEVPIVVAINKIDLPEANVQRVKQELANYDLIPEEWGGTTLMAEISAKQVLNIEDLMELILIQAEMLELKANPHLHAQGTVVESKLDPGRGPVATVLVQNGSLSVGEPFVVGIYSGKVRAMFNDQGGTVEEAGPSTPVEVLGLSGVPAAGDPFQVVESDKYSKQVSQKRQEMKRIESAQKVKKVTLEDLNEMIREGAMQELRIVIKGDVDGSVQALKDSLEKLSTDEIRVKVIHAATGGINESDVMLASASNALIIGYHVRPTSRVAEIAEREKVSIKFYNIIYDVTNDIKAAMEGMLSPEVKEEVTGTGEIKQTFKVSKVGTVAGAVCLSGKVNRSDKMRLIRDGVVIYDGEMKSLKRFKDDVSVVEGGQEFGFGLKDYNDIKEGDAFESYRTFEVAKKLEDVSRKKEGKEAPGQQK